MGSEREQQFCLRWHNYQNCLLATLPQLLDGDDLTDVTLCAGGRSIRAHRVVLSACSQYFKDLFKEMIPIQHPVIVLPGTYFTDLVALVTFMYSGEVNVYEHQLAGLLSVAETLQIRGLAEFTWSGNLANSEVGKKENTGGSPRCKRVKTTAGSGEEVNCSSPASTNNNSTSTTVKSRSKTVDDGWVEANANVVATLDQPTLIAEDLSHRSADNIEADPGPPTVSIDLTGNPTDLTQGVVETKSKNSPKLYATCFVCGKQLSNQYNLRVHMETHQNAHYACSACNHVSRSRDALRKHVSYRHPPSQTTPTPRQP
ncbi:longitudinals lacking protein, isoforms H/M/V-like [Macrosteles quadrilineatus]|uniref:longitudinals lacking protein, isoforms H/M/V-like n=1 Tax=Macrosteles quadrilineatus TaxID=74068 RepID=UPI0023E2C03D|nr:longitudinals lacking protein, isoforms H/M/V-like [Macrosteles quadrilineatus]